MLQKCIDNIDSTNYAWVKSFSNCMLCHKARASPSAVPLGLRGMFLTGYGMPVAVASEMVLKVLTEHGLMKDLVLLNILMRLSGLGVVLVHMPEIYVQH